MNWIISSGSFHPIVEKSSNFLWRVTDFNIFKCNIVLIELFNGFVDISNIKEDGSFWFKFPYLLQTFDPCQSIPIISFLPAHIGHKNNICLRIFHHFCIFLYPLFQLLCRKNMSQICGFIFVDRVVDLSSFFCVGIDPDYQVGSDHWQLLRGWNLNELIYFEFVTFDGFFFDIFHLELSEGFKKNFLFFGKNRVLLDRKTLKNLKLKHMLEFASSLLCKLNSLLFCCWSWQERFECHNIANFCFRIIGDSSIDSPRIFVDLLEMTKQSACI